MYIHLLVADPEKETDDHFSSHIYYSSYMRGNGFGAGMHEPHVWDASDRTETLELFQTKPCCGQYCVYSYDLFNKLSARGSLA